MSDVATRWPWMTRTRAATLLMLAGGATVLITWNHRRSDRAFLAQLEQALPLSVALSADALADWVAVRGTHVRTLAAVAAHAPSSRGSADALRTMLPVVVAEGGYRDGQVEPALIDHDPPALRTWPPDAAEATAVVEFRAPIVRGGRTEGAVVLRAVLTERAFSHFNVAAPDDKTQRTALLLSDGDTVRLLTASGAGGGERSPESQSLPPGVTRERFASATYAQRGATKTRRHGMGTGLTGTRVVYAITPVTGTPWLLLREREVAELQALIAPALLVTDAVFGVLATLALVVMVLWWRAQHQQRETAAVQLRATFVASVSHELRTPLTQVRMYAEMLRLGLLPTPDERTRALQVIEKEAERLTMLIERALAFVRTGQAAPPPPQESVAVAPAVARALDAMAALAAERHVRWRHQIDEALRVQIARDDLHQVLLNLLDNAVKYGPVGQAIEITAQAEESTVRIAVRDQGPGVAATEREAIWQPFRRGFAAASWSVNGTGIGLVVVRDLVERAGGRAWVEPAAASNGQAPAGAVFVIALPPGY